MKRLIAPKLLQSLKAHPHYEEFRSIATSITVLFFAIQQLLETFFSVSLGNQVWSSLADVLFVAILLYAGYKNQYIGSKGKKQLRVLQQKSLE